MIEKLAEECIDWLIPDEPDFETLAENVGVSITDRDSFREEWNKLRERWYEDLLKVLRETDAEIEEWADV